MGVYVQPSTPRKTWSLNEEFKSPDWQTPPTGKKVVFVDRIPYVMTTAQKLRTPAGTPPPSAYKGDRNNIPRMGVEDGVRRSLIY